MTHVSRRYLPHLLVLMLLLATPLILRQRTGFENDPCREPEALLYTATRPGPTAPEDPDMTRKRSQWLERAAPEGAWAEGAVAVEGADLSLRTLVVRSYDAKLLYHFPEVRFGSGEQSGRTSVAYVQDDGGPRLPIREVEFDRAGSFHTVTAYLLVYGGRAVGNPYLAQLAAAPRQMITGSEPMTLFMVWGLARDEQRAAARAAARDWLLQSWRIYESTCR